MPEAGEAHVGAVLAGTLNARSATGDAHRNVRRDDRVLGFDFGLKRIGVATGNTRTGTSQGLSTVRATDGTPDWPEMARLIGQWLPATLVVGLPLNMDGSQGEMAARVRQFGERAGRRFGLDVVYVDERLSTAEAEDLLARAAPPGKSLRHKRRKHRDPLAAELIVRTYLEDLRPGV